MPKQHTILKDTFDFSGIPHPRKIGAHSTADKHILFKIHGQGICMKQFLQDYFKTMRFGANFIKVSPLMNTFPQLYSEFPAA